MALQRFLPLLILFLPIGDLILLIQIAGWLGIIPTVALILLAASVGSWLLRQQGLETINQVRASIARGELPATKLLEGVVLMLSAALLIAPGFFTDFIAILGLIPPLRRRLVKWVLRRGFFGVVSSPHSGRATEINTIEGEFWRDD